MKVIFVGTPEIALPTYEALSQHHEIVAVLTQTDKPVGRSKQLVPSPICEAATKDNVPVYKADKISPEITKALQDLQADIFVTFAYGVILPRDFLTITHFGGINIHPSLLPKLRGPSPMQTALLNGEQLGITVQQIAYKVDSGDILFQEVLPTEITDDIFDVTNKVATRASQIILEVLTNISNGTVNPVKQNDDDATFCKMINKEDGKIDFNDRVSSIVNKIRAFAAWPIAFSNLSGQKLLIHKAIPDNTFYEEFKNVANGQIVIIDNKKGVYIKCSDGLLKVQKLQLQGKSVLDDKNFANGGKRFLNMILE